MQESACFRCFFAFIRHFLIVRTFKQAKIQSKMALYKWNNCLKKMFSPSFSRIPHPVGFEPCQSATVGI